MKRIKVVTIGKLLLSYNFWNYVIFNVFNIKRYNFDIETHLEDYINWLIFGFEKTGKHGVPVAYIAKIGRKWSEPYYDSWLYN